MMLSHGMAANYNPHYDPYYQNVILQIGNNNVTNGSTVVTDQSKYSRVGTLNGNTVCTTSTAPSGMSSSIYFDGNRDFITLPDAPEWDLGASIWTVEAKIKFNTLTNYGTLICQMGSYPGSGQAGWWIILPRSSDQNVYFEWTTNGSTWNYVSWPWSVVTGQWYDIMLVRSGSTMNCLINGVYVGSTPTVSGTIFNSNATVDIGGVSGQGANTYDLDGWVSNLRFTSGVAKIPGYMPAGELPLDKAPWNYTTLHPFRLGVGVSLSNNNLTATLSSSTGGNAMSIRGHSTGSRFFEFTAGGVYPVVGLVNASAPYHSSSYPGIDTNGYGYYTNGNKYYNGAATGYAASWTTGDVIGVLINFTAGTITFFKNGISQGVAFSGISGTLYAAVGDYGVTGTLGTFNFGATAFAYGLPSGAVAWNS